jgi:hypothetical protein
MFSSSAITLRSERTKVRTLFTFASVLCVFGCPLLGTSYIYSLLQIHVTHFSANHIPRTRTTSSASRKRTTHLVYGLCRRTLEHVQTCLSTRICPTQHPIDKLLLFRELNVCTSYMYFFYFGPRIFLRKVKDKQMHHSFSVLVLNTILHVSVF